MNLCRHLRFCCCTNWATESHAFLLPPTLSQWKLAHTLPSTSTLTQGTHSLPQPPPTHTQLNKLSSLFPASQRNHPQTPEPFFPVCLCCNPHPHPQQTLSSFTGESKFHLSSILSRPESQAFSGLKSPPNVQVSHWTDQKSRR